MCGVAGAIGPQKSQIVERMTATLAHRGPEGQGFHHGPLISLGHRRLSIIDLEGGAQPLSDKSGQLTLVCNGEIYNSPELRRQLTARGHEFTTSTDVEVILHLYREHGADCVKHLRGMFAFALWDNRDGTLFLAKDHLGQKPLFYYQDDERFIFASEPKAILASGVVDPEPDLNTLWHYLSLRFVPGDLSFFKGIRKLPAASTLRWSAGVSEIRKYWTLDFQDKLTGSEADIEQDLDEVLAEAVGAHLLSDVQVGAFLSGGIDSTTITALMAAQTRGPLPAFSIGVADKTFDELPLARLVAEKHNLNFHERVVTPDLVHLLPTMVHHMDEPSDPFGIGVYLVSELASGHVKVVLGGDGADEIFGGYDRYVGQRLVDYYCLLPHWLREQVFGRLVDLIPETFGYKSLAQKAAWLQTMSRYKGGERYAQSLGVLRFHGEARDRLYTASAKRALEPQRTSEWVLTHFDADNASDLVDRMLFTDLMTRVPDHGLVVTDRMSMAHSLEVRSPFMDHRVVEYAARIPAPLKIKGRRLKYILRKVAENHLPPELVWRRKQGFGFPLGRWMRGDLASFIRNLLRDSRFVQAGIFDGDYIDQLLDEHSSGKVDHNYRLWLLANLEIWYRLYFENNTVESLHDYTRQIATH
jgi:asparagine synthase (glutamine-hydrolysing)